MWQTPCCKERPSSAYFAPPNSNWAGRNYFKYQEDELSEDVASKWAQAIRKMPREDHKSQAGAKCPRAVFCMPCWPLSPHTYAGESLNTSRKLALDAEQYSTAASRLITELLDQRCWDWVGLSSLAIWSRGVNIACPMKGCNSSMPKEKQSLIYIEQTAAISILRTADRSSPREEGSISLQAAPCPHQDEAQLVVPLHGALHNIPGCSTQLVPLTCEKSHIVFQHQSGKYYSLSEGQADNALKVIQRQQSLQENEHYYSTVPFFNLFDYSRKAEKKRNHWEKGKQAT